MNKKQYWIVINEHPNLELEIVKKIQGIKNQKVRLRSVTCFSLKQLTPKAINILCLDKQDCDICILHTHEEPVDQEVQKIRSKIESLLPESTPYLFFSLHIDSNTGVSNAEITIDESYEGF